MQTQDPQFRERTLAAFGGQPFADLLGMEAGDAGPGWFELGLTITHEHTQHDGIVHGGVVATLADTGAALAAHTLIAPGERVVTIEFKINFLRAAQSGRLTCRGTVLRPGRNVSVAEAVITGTRDGRPIEIAKAIATIAILPAHADERTASVTA